MAVSHVPQGQHAVCPYLVVRGVPALIEFARATFGAEVAECLTGPDGTVMHARVRIGDGDAMMGEAKGDWPPMPAMVHVYVPDSDAAYARALLAGAASVAEPTTHFYGDRSAGVRDACGNVWWISTHVEDVPPEELARRVAAERG